MTATANLTQKRLAKTRFFGRVIARLPFVSCVILNGSLASGTSKESSDIDILIIAKDGRIFSARFLVIFFATIFRIKRPKNDERGHAGKFCFNYFLTENFLKIPTGRGEKMDKYCAKNYSKSWFIAGDIRLFEKFILTNQELFKKYDCEVSKTSLHVIPTPWLCPRLEKSYKLNGTTIRRSLHVSRPSLGSRDDRKKLLYRFRISSLQSGMTTWVQRFWESVFSNWLEKLLKNYQIKKIESDPRTKKYPELIVYNDKELRFHPPK